ncbi:uncharacterized protein LY89DRAFT_679020 [Mollisia scopiformis]|uniref:Uncharacterized protein n=1 Tax=Mollisia scopiformis TaxID=149040 RepID=A0A194XVD3_MOLSC|nr:uncharacterized protein LY89DRAFT_679020 [Mollisia scopiformis]KUJ23667.1 hypothetical protein LY89DRAFT_679020 [Mollisia scopiformis]
MSSNSQQIERFAIAAPQNGEFSMKKMTDEEISVNLFTKGQMKVKEAFEYLKTLAPPERFAEAMHICSQFDYARWTYENAYVRVGDALLEEAGFDVDTIKELKATRPIFFGLLNDIKTNQNASEVAFSSLKATLLERPKAVSGCPTKVYKRAEKFFDYLLTTAWMGKGFYNALAGLFRVADLPPRSAILLLNAEILARVVSHPLAVSRHGHFVAPVITAAKNRVFSRLGHNSARELRFSPYNRSFLRSYELKFNEAGLLQKGNVGDNEGFPEFDDEPIGSSNAWLPVLIHEDELDRPDTPPLLVVPVTPTQTTRTLRERDETKKVLSTSKTADETPTAPASRLPAKRKRRAAPRQRAQTVEGEEDEESDSSEDSSEKGSPIFAGLVERKDKSPSHPATDVSLQRESSLSDTYHSLAAGGDDDFGLDNDDFEPFLGDGPSANEFVVRSPEPLPNDGDQYDCLSLDNISIPSMAPQSARPITVEVISEVGRWFNPTVPDSRGRVSGQKGGNIVPKLLDEFKMLKFHCAERPNQPEAQEVLHNSAFSLTAQILWSQPRLWTEFRARLPSQPEHLVARPLPAIRGKGHVPFDSSLLSRTLLRSDFKSLGPVIGFFLLTEGHCSAVAQAIPRSESLEDGEERESEGLPVPCNPLDFIIFTDFVGQISLKIFFDSPRPWIVVPIQLLPVYNGVVGRGGSCTPSLSQTARSFETKTPAFGRVTTSPKYQVRIPELDAFDGMIRGNLMMDDPLLRVTLAEWMQCEVLSPTISSKKLVGERRARLRELVREYYTKIVTIEMTLYGVNSYFANPKGKQAAIPTPALTAATGIGDPGPSTEASHRAESLRLGDVRAGESEESEGYV